jgi:hypothetical protein
VIDKGDLGKNTFCVYEIGSGEGPVIFMLHGGNCLWVAIVHYIHLITAHSTTNEKISVHFLTSLYCLKT